MTDLTEHVYSQPRVVIVWIITFAWAGNMSLFSTGSYSGAITGWLLTQMLSTLHIHLSAKAFAIVHLLIRKLAHLTEYGIFCLLLYHSFAPRSFKKWNVRSAAAALLAASSFSLIDEYHQSKVPSRTASWVDCGIDAAGAFLALFVFYSYRRLFTKKSKIAATNERTAEVKNGVAGE